MTDQYRVRPESGASKKHRPRYRVRPAIVLHRSGYASDDRMMWIAERRFRFLRLFPIWWSVSRRWRFSREEAWADVARDKELRAPLPPVEYGQ